MDTVPARLASLLAHVPDISVRAFEEAAGLKRGAAQKILDGESEDPRGSTLLACALVLGTTADFLAGGLGVAPSKQRVRRVLTAAVQAVRGAHTPRGSRRGIPRKGAARSAARVAEPART